MTPHQWKQVKVLFERLMNEEPARRKPYLDDFCHDQDVRQEVESLLSHHTNTEKFLEEKQTTDSFAPANPQQPQYGPVCAENNIQPGTIANEFRGTARFMIQRRLGAGGFGVVYQAYD